MPPERVVYNFDMSSSLFAHFRPIEPREANAIAESILSGIEGRIPPHVELTGIQRRNIRDTLMTLLKTGVLKFTGPSGYPEPKAGTRILTPELPPVEIEDTLLQRFNPITGEAMEKTTRGS